MTGLATITTFAGLGAQLGASDSTVTFMPAPSRRTSVFDAWLRIPRPVAVPAPRTQVLTRSLKEKTGWSNRALAAVLDATHPTVRALEAGQSSGHHNDLYARVRGVHDVAERIFLIAARDSGETNRLLTETTPDGRSAAELLAAGDYGAAYTAALDIHRPRRTTGLMQSIWPATPGTATTSLNSDD